MAKAISNVNVAKAVFDTANFSGRWLASFGRPELRGSWLIWSGSGAGKTTFILELCKYLSGFVDRVAYNSIEQGLSASFQSAWNRVNMVEIGSKIILLDKEPMSVLKARLRKRKSPDIIVIDSLMCLVGFSRRDYLALLDEFPNKLFIFIAHENNGKPDPAIGETIRRLSDVKIHIEGYVAQFTTRYENAETGEGGADFVIWEQGAKAYRARMLDEKPKRGAKAVEPAPVE